MKPFRFSATEAGILLCYLLVSGPFCWGDGPAGNAKFSGIEIPAPPAQNEKWTPPAEPKLLAELTGKLYGLGMADPRGCDYRQIKVMTGNVWGNYNGTEWNTDGVAIQTHGWVLPADDKNGQRFAVCWNGWVYPVLAVGDPSSVEDDVKAQLQPVDPKNQNQVFRRGLWSYTDAVGDEDALSYETPMLVKAVILMRLGKPELASAIMEAFYKNPTMPNNGPPKELGPAFEQVATMWLFSLFNRAICAQMRGDDDLALVSFQQLALVTPGVQQTFASFPSPAQPRVPGEGPFDFLKEVPTYLADMERRHAEAPHPSALDLGQAKFPDKASWIKALIADLEDVRAPQDGQPGWVQLDQNAMIKALVQAGDDAVDPLLDCLEHDNRYTRSVHFWRDFAPYRTVLGVHEAAYTALTGILKTSFFEIHSTGQDLTNSGPDARPKVVAAIRAYWQKRKGTSVEEQWFITLADDKASPAEWAFAAQNIAKSGQSLRAKTNPDVSGLLKKRILALPTQDMGDVMHQPSAPVLANALLTWDGPAAEDAVRDLCNAMAARYNVEKITQGITQPLIALTERLIKMGDTQILSDYVGWVSKISPEKAGDSQVTLLWFKPLWENPDNAAVQKADSIIFSDKNSPCWQFIHDKAGTNEGQTILRSPLLGLHGFRAMMLAGLADRTEVGESGYLVGNFWMVRYGFGDNGNQITASLNPLDPLSKLAPGYSTYRRCDLYAWGMAQAKGGMPALQFYWPLAKRDAAVAQAVATLQRYGERYKVTPVNPIQINYTYGIDGYCASPWFVKLDHLATPDDMQKGLAIFSLPPENKARIWPMAKYGATARWLAIKDFSHTEGHGDQTGRSWITVEYENTGRVWQAEEGFIDGKWQRFFGFTGDHCFAQAPAEEIEFPAGYSWQQLDQGFDCKFTTDGKAFKNPVHAGDPFPLVLKLRNRRGVDQDAPESLYQPGDKSLASGVEIHLYRKNVPAPNEIVNESDKAKTGFDWVEVPRKQDPHFPLPTSTHHLAPMDELQVLSCDLGDYYDFSKAGEYYATMTLDPVTVRFTGGTSNVIQFFVK